MDTLRALAFGQPTNGDVVSAPAGWHADPENPGQLRYFDGTQWTEHRAPLPAPPVAATAPEQSAAAPTYAVPTGHAAPAQPGKANKTAIIVTLSIVAAIAVIGSIGSAIDKGGSDEQPANAIPNASDSDSPTPEPSETIDPKPKGTYTHTCDMLLFTGPNDQSYVVGTARLKNTGDVPVKLLVKGSWVQVGSKPIVKTETVTVPVGQRDTVNFKVPITTGQVSAYQSGYDLPKTCTVKATVIN